jgi:general secretion pathway protein A
MGLAGLLGWAVMSGQAGGGNAVPAVAMAAGSAPVAPTAAAAPDAPDAAAGSVPGAAANAAAEPASAAQVLAAPAAAVTSASSALPAMPAATVAAVPSVVASVGASAPASVLTGAAPTSAAVAIAEESQAWRELAVVWGLSLAAGEPCVAAARQQVQCFRGSGGLALIRQLDRPGIVTLRDEDGRRGYALLLGLGADGVTLRLAGGSQRTVPLAEMARLWRGDFATFWRAPPGFEPGRSGSPPAALADWLAPRLPAPSPLPAGAAAVPRDDALRAQVQAFQLAQGIKPDGRAGPLTLMLVNRASGVAEPRLQPER